MSEAGVLERREEEATASRLGALFDVHHRRLYRLALRLSGNRADAEDLVQETFVRAARAVHRIPDDESGEEAWLVRVLVNVCRDGWRRANVRAAHSDAARGSSEPNPERGYAARLAVRAALARLAPRRRAIVVLHELDGVEVQQISRMLRLSAVTVRWHLSRARKELARVLRNEDGER